MEIPSCPLCGAKLVKKYPGGYEPYWPWWGCDSCRKWIRAWTRAEVDDKGLE